MDECGQDRPGSGPTTTTQTTALSPQVTSQTVATSVFPSVPRVTANLHREVFGFEKTFLDGSASIELRVPLLQLHGNPDAFSAREIGDLTILGKYALINNLDTGNVFTVGLAVTAPTGPSADTIDGNLHSTWLQPWFGYIWNADRFYLHAFHSVVVPTDSRDVTLLGHTSFADTKLGGKSSNRNHARQPHLQRLRDGQIATPPMVSEKCAEVGTELSKCAATSFRL